MHPPARTLLVTAVAMLAFAANSLLCRLALLDGSIDPASFGSVRLAAGALALAAIVRLRPGPAPPTRGDWFAATMLWAYVTCFSFAYVTLQAGTGALILFGAVQLTMFSGGLFAGERFAPSAWAGLVLALGGLLCLAAPGLTAPPLLGAALMAVAGVAWGLYSLRGRGAGEPVAATAGNFLRALPLALAISAVFAPSFHANVIGAGLAAASGAITSGLGYVVWYAALPRLSALRASAVQLSVPPLAAFGGVVVLAEAVSMRLLLASTAILGGVALVLLSRSLAARPHRGT